MCISVYLRIPPSQLLCRPSIPSATATCWASSRTRRTLRRPSMPGTRSMSRLFFPRAIGRPGGWLMVVGMCEMMWSPDFFCRCLSIFWWHCSFAASQIVTDLGMELVPRRNRKDCLGSWQSSQKNIQKSWNQTKIIEENNSSGRLPHSQTPGPCLQGHRI